MAKAIIRIMRDRETARKVMWEGVEIEVTPLGEDIKDEIYRESHFETEGGKASVYNGRRYVLGVIEKGVRIPDDVLVDAISGDPIPWDRESIRAMDEDPRQELLGMVLNPAKNLVPRMLDAKKTSPSG